MRGSRPLFLILILLATVLQPVLAIDEVVDDYVDTSLVDYLSDGLVHNATLDFIEVVYGESVYENLSAYTEVDGDGDLTVVDISVTWASLRRDAESWLVYDFGVDYLGNFKINFTLGYSDVEAGDDSGRDIMALCLLSNSIGTFADVIGGDLVVILPRQSGLVDDRFKYVLRQFDGGVGGLYLVDDTVYVVPNTHYCTLERVGTRLSLIVWSDEARTALIENISGVGDVTAYRYFHILASYDSVGDGADHSSGVLSNITFPGGGYGTGWFNTTDLLAGVGYNATALLTNSSIITGSINVEVLEGGSWTDLGTIANGYDALDLRDNLTSGIFRLNYTGGNDPLRLYQLRLVHEAPGVSVSTAPYLAMAIILLMLGLALGMGIRR